LIIAAIPAPAATNPASAPVEMPIAPAIPSNANLIAVTASANEVIGPMSLKKSVIL
jgi:hypothetical protein